MKKKINLKKLFIILLIIVPIGFAVLTSNLNIKGSFSFLENSFNVYLDKVKITTSTAENTTTNLDSNKSSISITGNFKKPGDYIEFSFYAINGGTIDAVIDNVEITGIENSLKKYFNNTIKYIDTADVKKNDFLQAGAARKIIVQIKYKYEVDEFIPVENLNVSINLKYIQSPSSNNTSWNYEFIDQEQYFIVPKSGTYKIELWGASGGASDKTQNYGAYTSGEIGLEKNQKLYIYTGAKGDSVFNKRAKILNKFNGGGSGDSISGYSRTQSSGGSATDIRIIGGNWNDFDSLKSRIMVASGAGGSFLAYNSNTGKEAEYTGGPGGGVTGYDGTWDSTNNQWGTYGSGGTQTSPGYTYCLENTVCSSTDGSWNFGTSPKGLGGFGYGGTSPQVSSQGGGSGYYGGGSSMHVQSAGGGSSFISGHTGCDAISEASTEDNIVHTGQSIHYSGMKFINTVMIDGKGYQWTTEKGEEVVGMPSYDGKTTMIGNNGNGYAKITLVEEDGKYLCKRATSLHTRTCKNNLESIKMCTAAGYNKGDTIPYGSIPQDKNYNSGDAFDCDVNGDGIYNPEEERFYYVTDLESNSSYGVLIYSSTIKNGKRKTQATDEYTSYDTSGNNFNGPISVISDLPTTNQWSNVRLYNNKRQILSSEGNKSIQGTTLPTFEYTNKTSRLITMQEAKKSCSDSTTVSKKCEFLLEDTSFDNPNLYVNNWGIWTETPYDTRNSVACHIDSHGLNIGCLYNVSGVNHFLVKPVIEVHKNKIQ